jgi:hypothetical protein
MPIHQCWGIVQQCLHLITGGTHERQRELLSVALIERV